MNTNQFKSKAQALFLKANPTATISGWTYGPKRVTWPTGRKGIAGRFFATAPGFRPKQIMADWDGDGIWVR